jgi:RNA polymerase sigma-70 factor (ECF subfamily)
LRSLASITEIFLACRAQLARAVPRIVPPQDIEDIVQATYVRVCQYNTRNEITEPKALMISVARNLALDHVKRAEHRLTTTMDESAELESALASATAEDSYHSVASSEEFSIFCDAVRRLPVQCRRVFVLKKVYGFSQREIARELGLAESTVEKHIATGMHQCVRFMTQQPRKHKGNLRDGGTVAAFRGSRR